MYAEYKGAATEDGDIEPLYVWRSTDGGIMWSRAFWLNGHPEYGIGDIRHFHTCLADPDISGRWYVSTGDRRDDNRLYISDDDGMSWERITIRKIVPSNLIDVSLYDTVLRYVTAFFDGRFMYWATDDNNALSRAILVRLDRFAVRDGVLEVVGVFGENLARNVIRNAGENEALMISESKFDVGQVDLWFVDRDKVVKKLPGLKNESSSKTMGSGSISSKAFSENMAYSFMDGRVFGESGGGTSLNYTLTSIPRNTRLERFWRRHKWLATASDPLIAFFHSQRTAGTTIKEAFKAECGVPEVYYQRTVDDFLKWRDLSDDRLSGKRVFAAHDNYTRNDSVTRPLFLFSVVRDPVDRAISLYYYLRNREEHRLHGPALENDVNAFYRVAADIAHEYVANTQCRRVCGQPDFDTARKTILEEFALVAPYDNVDKAMHCVGEFFSFEEPNRFKMKKSRTQAQAGIDSETVAEIRRLNAEDVKLFAFVNEIFPEMVRSLTSVTRSDL